MPAKKKRTPTPPVRGLALATLDAVRRELAFVYTQIKRREVQDDHGRTLVYALSTVAGVLKAEAELRIEERFGELEEKIVQLRGGRPE